MEKDPANEALTIQELDEASKLGLTVATCRACKRPTLFALSNQVKVEPVTCGRMPCGREAGEPWSKDRG